MSFRAYSSKGRNFILGRIVSASGQIFRSDFRPQDEIFRPGMRFRPLDEQTLLNWSNIMGNCIYTIEGRTLKDREKANFVLTSNAD